MSKLSDSNYEFLRKEFSIEDGVEALFDSLCRDGQLGERAGEIYQKLDDGLSLLAQLASCQWGCKGGDHIRENLLRRLVNYSLASIRLAKLGLYDESLAILRALAELANLIELFTVRKQTLSDWLVLSPKERWKKFNPKSVRCQIKKTKDRPIVDGDTYRKLCALGVHVTPGSVKTSHQIDSKVHVGGAFSVPAFLLVLNQLAIILGPILKLSGHFSGSKPSKMERLMTAGTDLEGTATSWLQAVNYKERLIALRETRSSEDSSLE